MKSCMQLGMYSNGNVSIWPFGICTAAENCMNSGQKFEISMRLLVSLSLISVTPESGERERVSAKKEECLCGQKVELVSLFFRKKVLSHRPPPRKKHRYTPAQ